MHIKKKNFRNISNNIFFIVIGDSQVEDPSTVNKRPQNPIRPKQPKCVGSLIISSIINLH